jgi:hypothetical protein
MAIAEAIAEAIADIAKEAIAKGQARCLINEEFRDDDREMGPLP